MQLLETTVNHYSGIAEYYDLVMANGYYNHATIAAAANAILGDRETVIEIGVGTGLLLKPLSSLSPRRMTGVDFTEEMLVIARRRLGSSVTLIEADVMEMSLNESYDAALSCGGVWHMIHLGDDEYQMSSHIPGYESNLKGLSNLAAHLRPGGLLLLSVQGPHLNYEKSLPGGIVYSQHVVYDEAADICGMEKDYFFHKDGQLLAQEHVSFTFFKNRAKETLMSKAGFQFESIDPSGHFWIYSRMS